MTNSPGTPIDNWLIKWTGGQDLFQKRLSKQSKSLTFHGSFILCSVIHTNYDKCPQMTKNIEGCINFVNELFMNIHLVETLAKCLGVITRWLFLNDTW